MIYAPNESKTATAGAAASEIDLEMAPRRQYRLAATTTAGLWFRIVAPGAAGAAVGGDGSHYLAPGATVLVAPIAGRTRVSVIREDDADATAILSEIATVVA